MPYRTLTNNTPTLDPKLLPTHPTRRTTLVSAITPAEIARRRTSAAQAHAVATIQTLVTPTTPPPQTVFTPSDGATEKTSAMDRARATVYRMHPMTAILALLASGLALWLPLDLGLALCIFAATAIAGYGIQAHDAGNNVAEGGVFAVLKALELVLGTIYTLGFGDIVPTNDRARALVIVAQITGTRR